MLKNKNIKKIQILLKIQNVKKFKIKKSNFKKMKILIK